MGKIKCCYKCQDRHIATEGGRTITCHSTCKRYIEERQQLDEENAERIRRAKISDGLDCQMFESQRKTFKRKRTIK